MPRPHAALLALDPGLRDLGYAVFVDSNLLLAGVLPLRHLPASQRLRRVRASIGAWVRGYRVRTLVLESIPRRPLDQIGGLPGLGRSLRLLARNRRLKLATYSARSVRRTVVGDGWAGKREAAEALVRRYPELRVHLTHDRKWKEAHCRNMFDAVGLGLHHQRLTNPPSRSR